MHLQVCILLMQREKERTMEAEQKAGIGVGCMQNFYFCQHIPFEMLIGIGEEGGKLGIGIEMA